MTQFEREEEQLLRDLQDGYLTCVEYNEHLTEMHRSYAAELREQAQEAADEAYNNVMGYY